MAIADLGLQGSANATTSGTTLAITNSTGAIIPAGTVLVLALVFDNAASITAPTLSLTAAGGGTWNQVGATTGQGVTTTAGAGIWAADFTCTTGSSIAIGATITTVTFGTAVVSKAGVIVGYSGAMEKLRCDINVTQTTAGLTGQNQTTPGALVAGDVVIGSVHSETNTTPVADADTTNGTWSAVRGAIANTGTALTSVTVGIQSKIISATGTQTFNGTAANDAVGFVYVLVPTGTVTTLQVSRDHAEVLVRPVPTAQVSRAHAEALVNPQPVVQMSRAHVEMLFDYLLGTLAQGLFGEAKSDARATAVGTAVVTITASAKSDGYISSTVITTAVSVTASASSSATADLTVSTATAVTVTASASSDGTVVLGRAVVAQVTASAKSDGTASMVIATVIGAVIGEASSDGLIRDALPYFSAYCTVVASGKSDAALVARIGPNIKWWDGTDLIDATLLGWWDGSSIQFGYVRGWRGVGAAIEPVY